MAEGIIFNAATEWLYRTTDMLSPTSSYTVMGWLKMNSISSSTVWHPVFGLVYASDGDEFAVRYDTPGYFFATTWLAGNAGFETGNSSYPDTTGSWHHIAWTVTVSGTSYTVRIYVDGVLEKTGSPGTLTSRFTQTKMMIGAAYDVASPTDTFDASNEGEVACVKAWQSVLDATEISTEKGYLLPQKSGCVLCVTGIDGHDYSGTGDFSVAGSPTAGSGPSGVEWPGASYTPAPSVGSLTLAGMAATLDVQTPVLAVGYVIVRG